VQNQIIGYAGLVLLVVSFLTLLDKRTAKWFTPIDLVATCLLIVYAAENGDIIFTLVNTVIASVLLYRLLSNNVIR